MKSVLEGIRVVTAAKAMAAPMCGRLLADLGADVIHIEHPVTGGITRTKKETAGGKIIPSDIQYGEQNINRNKRSLNLDFSREGGRQILYRLLKESDVFLNNFRPREIEKFKLGYEVIGKLNPRIIYACLTGWGRKGPDRDLPGYEHISYYSRSGFYHVQPWFDSHPFGSGDNITGLAMAYGILAALIARDKYGIGQEVDASLFHTGLFAISWDVSGALVTGQDRRPVPRHDFPNSMECAYQTKDNRWLYLGMPQPDLYWAKLCRAIERPDLERDPRFESFRPRLENHRELFKILEETFLSKTLDDWRGRLNENGLAWGPVQSLPEVVNDPQARANDYFVPLEHPTYGKMEVVANPVKLSKTPAEVRMPAPEFGQHTEEILLELGYGWDDITKFKDEGAIA